MPVDPPRRHGEQRERDAADRENAILTSERARLVNGFREVESDRDALRARLAEVEQRAVELNQCVVAELTHSEGHLVTYIRKLEAELDAHRREDFDVLRAMHAREAEQQEAVRRAEERGYDRGVLEAATGR